MDRTFIKVVKVSLISSFSLRVLVGAFECPEKKVCVKLKDIFYQKAKIGVYLWQSEVEKHSVICSFTNYTAVICELFYNNFIYN